MKASGPSARLEGRGLGSDYGPTRALDGVDLVVSGGEALAVFGPNGAGKTTLLRVLGGERTPDRGCVLWGGAPVDRAGKEWRARSGLVSHRTGLYSRMTVVENLRFFAGLHGLAPDREALAGALARVGAERTADVQVRLLSRGQRQRVALARLLLHDPRAVFLDEPFTGLDPIGAEALETALRDLLRRGRVVVLATHDIARGLALAGRFVVLRAGRVEDAGVADPAQAGRVAASLGVPAVAEAAA